MILRVLKKVIVVGAITLGYLHKASCKSLAKEARYMHWYWNEEVACLKTEVKIRSDFLKKIEAFRCEEIPSDILNKDIRQGKINLSNIEIRLELLTVRAEKLRTEIRNLTDISDKKDSLMYRDKPDAFQHEINELYTSIAKLLPPAFVKIDLVSKAIRNFDSHMLKVVRKYSKMKNKNSRIHELVLFKLAEKNKPLAVRSIYSFFRVDPYRTYDDIEAAINDLFGNGDGCMHTIVGSFIRYVKPILKIEVEKAEVCLLESVDKHIQLIINNTLLISPGKDIGIIDMYLKLINKDVLEKEISQCMDITPRQLIEILIVECAINMTKCHFNYRKNILLANLGKVIMSIGNPARYSTDIRKGLKIARSR
ncbi:hypothetical protein NEMIN01_2502, partial [Nematocida minor]|uniref:uncharacterized protein n=1 Tax=Nematocida minor TaxID=1912983 RepID=UPI0022202B1D